MHNFFIDDKERRAQNDTLINAFVLIHLRQIEVTAKAIEKWNGILPQVTSGAVPFIDVRSFETKR